MGQMMGQQASGLPRIRLTDSFGGQVRYGGTQNGGVSGIGAGAGPVDNIDMGVYVAQTRRTFFA